MRILTLPTHTLLHGGRRGSRNTHSSLAVAVLDVFREAYECRLQGTSGHQPTVATCEAVLVMFTRPAKVGVLLFAPPRPKSAA
jgi:hypothetical protein